MFFEPKVCENYETFRIRAENNENYENIKIYILYHKQNERLLIPTR